MFNKSFFKRIVVLALVLAIFSPPKASALSCARVLDKDFLQHGGIIAYGKVLNIRDTNVVSAHSDASKMQNIILDIEYAWTGNIRNKITNHIFGVFDEVSKNVESNTVLTWGLNKRFKIGEKYVVYINESAKDGHMRVNIGACSPSFNVRQDTDFNKFKNRVISNTNISGYSLSQSNNNTIDDPTVMERLQAQIQSLLAMVASLQQQLLQQTVDPVVEIPVPQSGLCEDFKYNLFLGKRDNLTNGEVTKLQSFLTRTGDYHGFVGGYFGPATEMAVKSWQRNHNVVSYGTPDSTGYGVVGPTTRRKMRCNIDLKLNLASAKYQDADIDKPVIMKVKVDPKKSHPYQLSCPDISFNFSGVTKYIPYGEVVTLKNGTKARNDGPGYYGILASCVYHTAGKKVMVVSMTDGNGYRHMVNTIVNVKQEDNNTTPIKVTAPNDGEIWTMGKLQTITWSPYNYGSHPQNPSQDVEAYLDRKNSNGSFSEVGKVVNGGKASIHWYDTGLVNSGGSNYWVNEGEYYIRVVNQKTGASDRSDRAFTLRYPAKRVRINKVSEVESYGPNDKAYVNFTTFGMDNISLALYKNDKWFKWIKSNITPKNTIYDGVTWTPYDTISESDAKEASVYKYYITGRKIGGGYSDAKTNAFRFESSIGDMNIIFPAANSNFTKGDRIKIRWSDTGSTPHTKYYIRAQHRHTGKIITPKVDKTYYYWTIPNSMKKGLYDLKICRYGSPICADTVPFIISDREFINVSTPKAGTKFNFGDEIVVNWSGKQASNEGMFVSLADSHGNVVKTKKITNNTQKITIDTGKDCNNFFSDAIDGDCIGLKNKIAKGDNEYYIRLSTYTPKDACLGYCPQHSTHPHTTTRDYSGHFTINSENVLGTTKGYMDDHLFITTENVPRINAVNICKNNHKYNPLKTLRCTWNGEEVYNKGPLVVDNNKSPLLTTDSTQISVGEDVTFKAYNITGGRAVRCKYSIDFGDVQVTSKGAQTQAVSCYAPTDLCVGPGVTKHQYQEPGTYTAKLIATWQGAANGSESSACNGVKGSINLNVTAGVSKVNNNNQMASVLEAMMSILRSMNK